MLLFFLTSEQQTKRTFKNTFRVVTPSESFFFYMIVEKKNDAVF